MSDHECNGDCDHCAHAAEERQDAADCRIRHNLAGVRNSVVVLSGKGGVGKSTVAANLAAALALAGRRVGLLDVDVHGPSITEMLGLRGATLMATEQGEIQPVDAGGVKVMSVGLAVPDPDAAIIWRGPMKLGVIQQFLSQVDWGELDYLIVDAPPGTGDEPLTVCQSLPDPLGAVVVTTPQDLVGMIVAKAVNMAGLMNKPVIGLVENMSYFRCPDCGKEHEIFGASKVEAEARAFGIKTFAKLPIDPVITAMVDAGEVESIPGEALAPIADYIEKEL